MMALEAVPGVPFTASSRSTVLLRLLRRRPSKDDEARWVGRKSISEPVSQGKLAAISICEVDFSI